ncbi:MAG: ribonuclease E/G, partial [Ornithinibacter sp.]
MASENDQPTSDATADAVLPVDVAGTDAAPAPAEKPKRRRATKKAAAPEAAPDAVVATDAVPDHAGVNAVAVALADADPTAPDAPAPVKKAPRKRATKAATAKAGATTEPATSDPASSEPVTTKAATAKAARTTATKAEAKAPAKRTRKATKATKATKAATSTEPAAEPVLEDVAAAVEEELPARLAQTGEAVLDDGALDVQLAAPTEEPEEAEPVAEPEEAPAVPSFGLLFQAPEPVAPRRRRATAPVQAPAERVAEPEQPATTTEADAPADDESPAEVAEPRTGRRSRGGRGGRGARSAQGQADEVSDATEAADGEASTEQSDGATSDRGPDEAATDEGEGGSRSRRRRGGRGRRGRSTADDEQGTASDTSGEPTDDSGDTGPDEQGDEGDGGTSRRRRRRRRGGASGEGDNDDPPGTTTRVREPRSQRDEPTAVKGSTRLEAKKQRRREGREAGRRRTIITEAEFLARRESVERVMVVRGRGDRTQIGVLEDGVLVEHYVSRETTASMAGNVYLGRVQNVLPSMEAAFVDIGKGRNAVLYAGEVNWDAAGLDGQPKRIEHALKSGEAVLVQVTKEPMGHKGARLTSQVSLPGRYLVYVPDGSMTGISRKLPDTERARLKKILRDVVPEDAGVIVRTAAEGASEEELERDVSRLTAQWDDIKRKTGAVNAPALLYGEPDLAIRVVRDVFNEDFGRLVVSGEDAWDTLEAYIGHVAPDLVP